MQGPPFGGVPVMPNASLVTGTVQGVERPVSARFPVLELTVRRVEDVEDMANFVTAAEGETIPIHLRGHVREGWLTPQTHVRLRVEFRGDERGGGFYAHADDIERLDDLEEDEL